MLYTFLAVLVSLTAVNAFSIAIRMPSLLSKGGGRGGGIGGVHGSPNGGGGSHGIGRGSSGDTGHPAVSFPAIGGNGRFANYFSYGGGKPFILPSSSAFAGRSMGGGTRDQVIGTPRYASGYPYSVNGPEYDTTRRGVFGQPFPFGFYPIYWGYHGYGGEYAGGEGQNVQHNLSVPAERPGGNLSYVQLTTHDGWWYSTGFVNESYWMIGDYESVSTILSLLVDPLETLYGCIADNNTIRPFITVREDGGPLQYNTSSTTLGNSTLTNYGTAPPFRFENVIQWYRASSFALAYQGYNNTYAFPPLNETTSPSDWGFSTPLPDKLKKSMFLGCANWTISNALPIIDGPKPKLSTTMVVGIVLGSVFGAAILGLVAFCAWKRYAKGKKKAYKAVADAKGKE